MMNQSDINYIIELLNKANKQKDWEYLIEAIEYLQEFQDDPKYDDE